MNYCNGIGQEFNPCEFPIVPGVNGTEVILMSFDIVNKGLTAFGVDGEIEILTLFPGENAFAWQAPKDSVKVSATSTQSGMVGSKYAQTVSVVGIGNTQLDYNRYEALTKGTSMAFVRQNDGSIDVYGYGVGLVDAGSTWNPNENDAVWMLNLGTNSELYEAKFLQKYTGTWASLQALTV
jgi:hypothetical protein